MSEHTIPSMTPHRAPLRGPWIARLVGLVLLAAFFSGFVEWFIIRVEVDAGQILVLVNKTGKRIPEDLAPELNDQVLLYPELVRAIAKKTGEAEDYVRRSYKGIRHEVLSEGRYFPNPYSFDVVKYNATVIGQNEMGVLIRKFGKPLPFPKTEIGRAHV